jgi:hypothetical protein
VRQTRTKMMTTLVTAVFAALAAEPAGPAGNQVVVPRGAPVQIAVVLDKSDSIAPLYTDGIRNAIAIARPVARQDPRLSDPVE